MLMHALSAPLSLFAFHGRMRGLLTRMGLLLLQLVMPFQRRQPPVAGCLTQLILHTNATFPSRAQSRVIHGNRQ